MTLSLLLAAVLPAAAQTVPPHRFASAVQTALVAMGDGNEAGMALTDAVRDSGAEVVTEDIATPTALRVKDDGKPVIVVSPRVGLAPRVLAPHLAREAAKLALKDMPDCSEKRYMMRSLEVRAWMELGGEPATLPVIDPVTGASDPALAAEMKEWLDHDAQTALERLGTEAGTRDLPTLTENLRVDLETRYSIPEDIPVKRAQLRAYEAANKRFVEFLMSEREWKLARGLSR